MRFGDYLLSRNLATPEQISRALEFQRSSTRPLGKLARELGYISRKENVQVLLELKRKQSACHPFRKYTGFLNL